MQQLSRQERLDWLQLIRTRNVGPATFSDLIGHFGNAADALAALPDFARRGGSKGGFKLASRKDAERELDRLDALGAQLIASCEASYPRQLANCEAPPPLISLKGHPHLLHQRRSCLDNCCIVAPPKALNAFSCCCAGLAARGKADV